MIRTMLAGLAAAFSLALPAIAAPPPPPPALPEDTPEHVDGFYTPAIYGDFVRWLQDEADAAIQESHEAALANLEGEAYTQLLDIHIHADWYYRDVAGSLERICHSRPDDYDVNVVGTSSLSNEQIEEHCTWQLRLIDGPGSEELARSWMGAAFDPVRAAAYLREQGVTPDTKFYEADTDWSGYHSASAFRTETLRTRTWTSLTCDAFTPALQELESYGPGKFDVPDFGREEEEDHDIPHSSSLEVTVFTLSGGSPAELTFRGTAGIARQLIRTLDGIVGNCEPVEAG